MRIHSLQHVQFEDLANIEPWAKAKGYSVSKTFLANNEKLPSANDFDWLIIMGGPMNVYEEELYPWLVQEKKLIGEAIAKNKLVLGICLGAQLIADVLGGRVYKNKYKEIGWFPVSLTEEAQKSSILNILPREFTAFHWHGDTFRLPTGCLRVAESEGCLNQAFEFDDGRVIGLQFHLESSAESIRGLIENCGAELSHGKYIQTANEILRHPEHCETLKVFTGKFLDRIESATKSRLRSASV